MTTAPDPLTPIFNALARELSTRPGGGAHAATPKSACTPVQWFGPMPSPVHGREGAATEVMPAVVDEQQRRAS